MKHFSLTAHSPTPQSHQVLIPFIPMSMEPLCPARAATASGEALRPMQTPSYSLPGLKTKKLDIQPARGQPHRPLVLLAGSHTAALQAKPAPPSPSTGTPPMDITTLGGSGKKPPQLLPRGDGPPDQQPSLPRPREGPGKKKMPWDVCFLMLHKPWGHGGGTCSTSSRSPVTSQTRESPLLREMPLLYHRTTLQGTQGASASCYFSHTICLQEDLYPVQEIIKAYPAGLGHRGHSTLVPNHRDTPEPDPSSLRRVQVHKSRPHLYPAMHIPGSNARKSLTRGTIPQDGAQGLVIGSIITMMVHPSSNEQARIMASLEV